MSEFVLKLEPAERVIVASKKLGEEPAHTNVKITNSGKDRCAFKVKCTSNELFRIRPPLGVLRNGDSSTIAVSFDMCRSLLCLVFQVTFNGGKTVPDSGKHYVAVYYIKVNDDKKTARQFWQDHKGEPHGTKRLYVDFKKEDAAAAGTPEKKDEEKKEEKKEDKKEEGGEKKEEEKKDEKKEEAGDKKDEEKKDDDKKVSY